MAKTKKQRMKLPHGFGSITEKTDSRRRRPFVIKKTIGGRQKVIGYASSYAEALALLVEYNKNPSLFAPTLITFSEIFELWKAEKYPKISENTRNGYNAAYKNSESLHKKKFAELKLADLQRVIDYIRAAGSGYSTQKKARVLFGQLYAYAIKYDMIDKDYSSYVTLDRDIRKYPKEPFTSRQINKLQKLEPEMPYTDTVLMMIFSGVRVGELLNLRCRDVRIRERYLIVTESKTEAGRGRVVPISRKTLPYFAARLENGRGAQHLIRSADGEKIPYHAYRVLFSRVMNAAKQKHTPHECRHTCATLLDNAGANETSIKRILGHASQSITKKVYTHKSIHELKKAIDLI